MPLTSYTWEKARASDASYTWETRQAWTLSSQLPNEPSKPAFEIIALAGKDAGRLRRRDVGAVLVADHVSPLGREHARQGKGRVGRRSAPKVVFLLEDGLQLLDCRKALGAETPSARAVRRVGPGRVRIVSRAHNRSPSSSALPIERRDAESTKKRVTRFRLGERLAEDAVEFFGDVGELVRLRLKRRRSEVDARFVHVSAHLDELGHEASHLDERVNADLHSGGVKSIARGLHRSEHALALFGRVGVTGKVSGHVNVLSHDFACRQTKSLALFFEPFEERLTQFS